MAANFGWPGGRGGAAGAGKFHGVVRASCELAGPWPMQDESGTIEADWLPIPDHEEWAVWGLLERISVAL